MPGPAFTHQPRVNISELRLEYYSASTVSEITEQAGGNVAYRVIGGQPIIESSDSVFGRNYVGGRITVASPQEMRPNTGSSTISDGFDTKYEATIVSILNDRLAIVSPPYTFKVEYNSNGQVPSLKYDFFPSEFSGSSYEITYRSIIESPNTGSFNFQSYVNIEIADMIPVIGNVSYIRTSMRTTGLRNFDVISEDEVTTQELFVNLTSSNNQFVNVGQMISANNANYYWTSSVMGGLSNVSNGIDNSIILNSYKIGMAVPTLTTPARNDVFTKLTSTNPIAIYKDNEYIISFKLAANAANDWDGTIIKSPKLDFWLSGSAIRDTNRTYGRIIDEYNPATFGTASINGNNIIFTNQFEYNTVDNPAIIPYPLNQSQSSYITNNAVNGTDVKNILAYRFKADKDGNVTPVFRLNTGTWYISDVSIKPYTLDGRTPTHFKSLIRIPSYQQNDRIDFKLEFLGNTKEPSNVSFLTSSLFFTGSNVYMNGPDNFLAGNMYLGNIDSFMNGAAAGTNQLMFQISGSNTYYAQYGDGEISSAATASFSDITVGASLPPTPPPTL